MTTPVWPADEAAIARAAAIMRAGGVVAFPTETVYGLGADARQDAAVAKIFAAKGRPSFNPLIVHVASLEAACAYGIFPPMAERLAARFWPGALTLIVPAVAGCPIGLLARAGLFTLGLRVPAHPVALALLRESACPIAAPSANISGHISPTTAAHVLADLDGAIDAIVDGGVAAIGVESTIVDCTGDAPVLLRPGGVALEDFVAALGHDTIMATEAKIKSPKITAPGQLASHYAPKAKLLLNAHTVAGSQGVLDFAGQLRNFVPAHPIAYFDLTPHGDVVEAASRLFAALRLLDDQLGGAGHIAVAPIPTTGLGLAINDRLTRAAAPK